MSTSNFGVRYCDQGFIFDVGGSSAFPPNSQVDTILGLLCSKLSYTLLKSINQTVNFQAGDIGKVPFLQEEIAKVESEIVSNSKAAVLIARTDWNRSELSWDFSRLSWIQPSIATQTINLSWSTWCDETRSAIDRLKSLEEDNNRHFIQAYGLQDELSPEVPESQITLTRADREKDSQRLISYAIGCMMGRYSLDAPGLIYAHAGNMGV